MTRVGQHRRGATLIELMIVLAMIAVLSGVAALAIRRLQPVDSADPWVRIAAVRRHAMLTGAESTIVVVVNKATYSVALHSDGRTLADSALHIDPLTGKRLDASH